MAKAIDRLRVQGSPAPFVHTAPATPSGKTTSVPQNTPHTACPDPSGPHVHCVHLVPDTRAPANSRDLGGGAGSSAPARRLAHLARVRAANHGLSTMDTSERPPPHTPSPRVHFMLRGQPAPGGSSAQANGRLSTSDGSSRPSQSRVRGNSRLTPAHSEPANGLMTSHQTEWTVSRNGLRPMDSRGGGLEGEGDDASLPSLGSGLCFMLAPVSAPPEAWRKSGQARAVGRAGTLELLGRRCTSSAPTSLSEVDPAQGLEPWGSRSPRRYPRSHLGAVPPPQLDASALRQCLLVRQSQRAAPHGEDDSLKLKHFTQFVRREGKVNYNNPYRNHKSKERRALGESRKYTFDSVNSYIHFNRIYPQVSGSGLQSTVPPMSGFPVHCTDTVLLRMMFDMNRPRMRKSSAKYSDVAKSRDLDEYLVVRPPSGSVLHGRGTRSPSKAHSAAKSAVSQTESAIPEEEIGAAWAGNDVTESPAADDSEEAKE